MTDTLQSPAVGARAGADTVVVVSCDTHIGPLLKAQLRPYCPAARLADFDEFSKRTATERAALQGLGAEAARHFARNLQTAGHHDPHARLHDMDYDGVAAEVIFHGSQNAEPIPFVTLGGFGGVVEDVELAGVGQHIYNQWLADFCSVEPERHVGLAHLPMWDVEAAVKELEWARAAGLRGVNFPALRADITPYEDPAWEPFWSACEALGMALANHGGAGNPTAKGPAAFHIQIAEGAALSRVSPVARLVFSGVFERHPRLKLVLTELPGQWWPSLLNELDSIYLQFYDALAERVPRRPSEYLQRSYFIGASFQSHAEAEAAVRDGYTANVLWGSDYPHTEGTFQYPASWEEPPITHLSMRFAYAGLPAEGVRRMLGENAIDVYGLDRKALEAVAARINAPTLGELAVPLEAAPAGGGSLSFRGFGPWY